MNGEIEPRGEVVAEDLRAMVTRHRERRIARLEAISIEVGYQRAQASEQAPHSPGLIGLLSRLLGQG